MPLPSSYDQRHYGKVTGAVRSRGAALHPVYEPPRPLPGFSAPMPEDQEGQRQFWFELLCEVQRQCVSMAESVPTEHPGFRAQVRRPAGAASFVAATASAADQTNANILALSNGLATFVVGNPVVVEFTIPQGFAGVIRGWDMDVCNGDERDISAAVEVDGGRTLQAFTPLTSRKLRAPDDLSTWGILHERQNVKVVATTTQAGPYLVTASMNIWMWPVERGSPDSARGLVLNAGRR